jgi:hypothetical protein
MPEFVLNVKSVGALLSASISVSGTSARIAKELPYVSMAGGV